MVQQYLLTYGEHLNPRLMAELCPTARVIGASVLRDYCLRFRGSDAFAKPTVEVEKGNSVPVLIWELVPAEQARLDLLAGDNYVKEAVKVKLERKTVSATVYHLADKHGIRQAISLYLPDDAYGL